MLIFILTLLFMIALLDKVVRIDRQKALALKTEFALSAVRDSLIIRVAKGEQPNNDAFAYFGKMVEHTNLCLDFPILWEWVVTKAFLVGDREEPDPEYTQFKTLVGHRDNEPVAEAFRQVQRTLGQYLNVRHKRLIWFLRKSKEGESRTEAVQRKLPSAINRSATVPLFRLVVSLDYNV